MGERGVSDWRRPKDGVAEGERAAGREGIAGGVGLRLGTKCGRAVGPVGAFPQGPLRSAQSDN